MAEGWPKKRRLLGTRVKRIDGPDKATGRAKYSYDINRPGMLHGAILRSPYAHAKIKSIDTTAAKKTPGFKAIALILPAKDWLVVKADADAGTLELKSVPSKKKKEKEEQRTVKVGPGVTIFRQNKVVKLADAKADGTYGVPTVSHQCLETHGLVAEWDKDGGLTVWASTQATVSTAGALAGRFGVPQGNVKCVTHFMGGGFGSKFGPDVQGIVAADLARRAGAPVKIMLDREEEITTAGNRPSAAGTVKIAGNKDGAITAFAIDCYGTPGYTGGATVNLGLLPYVYLDAVPTFKRV